MRKLSPINSCPMHNRFWIADGKAVGVFTGSALSWWDVGMGRQASPTRPGFAIQPAGCQGRYSLSPDGSKWVSAGHRNRDIGDLQLFGRDGRENEYGAFVHISQSTPAKTWTWRVGHGDVTATAFAPDGTKFAGTVYLPNGWAVLLWAVPK